MKAGDRVKLKGKTGLSGYGFYPRLTKHIKKHGYVTIDYVKPSGGCVFEEVSIGENMFGETQGLMPRHLVLVKKKRKQVKKKKK